ncbi:MAG: DUF188 domain-containing protein [Spirochaetaceae bacterium]|nr:DUF188 domain-containing protein [Spirochaetaceae bacterium]
MRILVDADSCPSDARRVILRAAEKRRIQAVFAANHPIPGVEGDFALMSVCPETVGAADDYLVETARYGDLAITRDIPLAGRLLGKGVSVLDDRGRIFTHDNIRSYLSIRNFQINLTLNSTSIVRHANYNKKSLKTFADSFDKLLTQLSRPPPPVPPAGLHIASNS